jgi:hypothetical protein
MKNIVFYLYVVLLTLPLPYAAVAFDSPRNNEVYALVAKHSGKCMAIPAASQKIGAGAIQFDCSRAPNFFFQLQDRGGGYFAIKAIHSGHFMVIYAHQTENGKRLIQYNVPGGNTGLWKFVQLDDGSYNIINKHSNKLIDVRGPTTNNGEYIHQWESTKEGGGENQRWYLFNVGRAYPGSQGTFQIISAKSNKCLDVAGSGQQNGKRVIQWTCHGDTNQIWRIVLLNGAPERPTQEQILKGDTRGYYIIATHSGKFLDVEGVSTANKATIHQWQGTGRSNQQWQLKENGDGTWEIMSLNSGKCLDVSKESTDDGAKIIQYRCHGGENQRWYLLPITQPRITITQMAFIPMLAVTADVLGIGTALYVIAKELAPIVVPKIRDVINAERRRERRQTWIDMGVPGDEYDLYVEGNWGPKTEWETQLEKARLEEVPSPVRRPGDP